MNVGTSMKLGKYSFGTGDRFSLQGRAQLNAIIKAKQAGIDISPVWNKSHREHTIVKTSPASVRAEADSSVSELNFQNAYHVDADHINLSNVDLFIDSSDFFTLDVADYIGAETNSADIDAFVNKHNNYLGSLTIENIDQPINITEAMITSIAAKILPAITQAGKIYRHIEKALGSDNFITEISMDETDLPQTPLEMLFILAAIAAEGIPAQTIASKFTGRFNKGVDYVGDVDQFEKEFNDDLAVIAFAVKEFSLPENLKLSIHSGSDKFSIYGPINNAIKQFDAGLHVKTAGTTWLEELIGLAMAGGTGLEIAKEIYACAYGRFDELCGPYATVIDIDRAKLPSTQLVQKWSGDQFANTLRHDQSCDDYDPGFRQLLHVSYKVAAEMGSDYLQALTENKHIIAKNVTNNIYDRHIKPLFVE